MNPRPSILLVDDDQEITELLSAYLARFQFDVRCAHDPPSMWQQLGAHTLDLAVLDAMLPGTDGLSLARDIRPQSRLPVIILTAVSASEVVCFDGWELHREDRTVVSPSGRVAALSNAEFRLFSTFLQKPRRLLSRDQLMEHARGRAMDAFERSIDLLVSRLRHKLGDTSSDTSLIKTVRGAGYMFKAQSVQARAGWRM